MYIGFNRDNGEVLLGHKEHNTLVKYAIKGGTFQEVWEKPHPTGFTADCEKVIQSTGDIVLNEENKQTMGLTPHLDELTLKKGKYGCLLSGKEIRIDCGELSVKFSSQFSLLYI